MAGVKIWLFAIRFVSLGFKKLSHLLILLISGLGMFRSLVSELCARVITVSGLCVLRIFISELCWQHCCWRCSVFLFAIVTGSENTKINVKITTIFLENQRKKRRRILYMSSLSMWTAVKCKCERGWVADSWGEAALLNSNVCWRHLHGFLPPIYPCLKGLCHEMNIFLKASILSVPAQIVFTIFCFLIEEKKNSKFRLLLWKYLLIF